MENHRSTEDDSPQSGTSDKLRERIQHLNEQVGDLSETLDRIDKRLTEVAGGTVDESKST
jgi:hypothetical protein